jgi:UMF1 family MFS transporter
MRPTRLAMIAWAFYDWANNAFGTIVQTFVFAAYFTRSVALNQEVGTTLWGNAIGIAGLIVALGGPVLGAVADQGGRRKPWIASFTGICVLATASLWFVRPATNYVWLALFLVGVGTIGAEFATIFYNAMLPDLVPRERMGRWSGWGWAMGYAGGLACLVGVLLGFITADHPLFGLKRESAQPVRAALVFAAAWYLLFALPLLALTPDKPSTGKKFGRAGCDGLAQLAGSLRRIRHHAHIVRFLIARMLYIDALATVFVFGGVFAAGTFGMDEQQVLLFGITLNVTAGLGAAGFAWIDDWIGSKRTILVALIGLMVPATLMLLVESMAWFWGYGLILGIFVGPVQAASRSYLSRVAPPELRTQLFGLYALSGKATAFVGPLLVGWVTHWSRSQRLGMGAVIVLFAIGFVVMLSVPQAWSNGVEETPSGDIA